MRNFSIIIFFLVPSIAFATQIRNVEDSEEFTAKISKYDINRIKVSGDRIRSIQNNSNELEISHDNKLGEIYIKVIKSSGNKPVNLFILTEKNFTYKALLYPKSIPSEQIIIKNIGVSFGDVKSNYRTYSLKNSSYKSQIIDLIKAMSSNRSINGYEVKRRGLYINLGDISMRRKKVYQGKNFKGEIYRLKNSTKKVFILEENIFYKAGVKAIKIEKETLLPGEISKIYIVS